MLHGVAKIKGKLLTVRFAQEQLTEFLVACELDGGTMSSVTRTFVFKKIRDAKERDPQKFAAALAEVEPAEQRRRVTVVEAKDEKKQQRANTIRKDGRRRASGGRKSG